MCEKGQDVFQEQHAKGRCGKRKWGTRGEMEEESASKAEDGGGMRRER